MFFENLYNPIYFAQKIFEFDQQRCNKKQNHLFCYNGTTDFRMESLGIIENE